MEAEKLALFIICVLVCCIAHHLVCPGQKSFADFLL